MLVRDWKRAPWGLLFALALMVFVQAPSLDARLYDDDYAQLAAARGVDEPTLAARSPLDLYRFFPGDAPTGRALMRHGAVPWWFEPSTQMSFFRPLSSALMVLDARVFVDHTSLYHLHSMLWCAAMLVAFWALACRVTPRSAELAVCLFAASRYSVWFGAVWWCNRHLVVSATFACVALWALARWRLEAWRPGRWLAPLSIILALLGGESGIQILAYVGAFELFASRRYRSLAMVGAGGALYLVARMALGYGTHGESIYCDPLHEPSRWLSLIASRAPGHVAAVVGGGVPAWPMGVLLLAIGGHAIMTKAIPARTLAWLSVGSLACFAVAVTSPADVLGLASVGALLASAAVAQHAWTLARDSSKKWPVRASMASGLVAIVGAQGAVSAVLSSRMIAQRASDQRGAEELLLRARIDRDKTRVVVVTGYDFQWAALGAMRAMRPDLSVRAWHSIGDSPAETTEVLRIDETTLEVGCTGANCALVRFDWFRGAENPLHIGDTIAMDGLTITVREVAALGPSRVRVSFASPNEVASTCFLALGRDGLQPIQLPE